MQTPGQPLRVLLVEDNTVNQQVLLLLLQKQGCQVSVATNGVEAVEAHEQGKFDLILLATGYKLDYPFIERSELNWPEGAGAPQLYLNVFHPQRDDLFVLGMVEASGLGWQGRDEQAELVALYIRQLQTGSPAAQVLRQTIREQAGQRLDGGYRYLPLERMAYYVHKDSYRRRIAAHSAVLRRELSESAYAATQGA